MILASESGSEKKSIPDNPHTRGSWLRCGCRNIFIPYNCRTLSPDSCEYCRYRRAGKFFHDFYYKYNRALGKSWDDIQMWTLGTSIKYTYSYNFSEEKYYHNLGEIISIWQKFNTMMKVYSKRSQIKLDCDIDVYKECGIARLMKRECERHYFSYPKFNWNPLVYVVEAGSTGERLHIHLLHKGFLKQSIVKAIWRFQTKEKSNVNFVKADNVGYLAKYVSKSLLKYSFLGQLYKVKLPRREKVCYKCDSSWELMSQGIEKMDVPSVL